MDFNLWFLGAICLYLAGALAGLLGRSNLAVRWSAGGLGALGSLALLIAGISGLGLAAAGSTAQLALWDAAPFGALSFQVDGLSALMLVVIGLLGVFACWYSIDYLEIHESRSLNGIAFFSNLFLAAMALVVCANNAFYFLIFWELMTLTSYFLVIFDDHDPQVIQAGYLYMLVAHAGAAAIMLAFLALYSQTGSFAFADFHAAELSPAAANLVFLLAFLGFAAKAGVVPLHIWLPRAHPAAPSHISALMSGVMIKTAVYGILRVCVDLLGAPAAWWGVVVLCFGCLSAILGVLYALVERDIKRLLAYSSVENIGIILIGVGVGMVGVAEKLPALALAGFLAALYHLLNHALFKGLLFLGAGAVIHATATRDLERLGGLAKRMPWTAAAFLTGALAVSAIPPLNGFASEWFTYQALFSAGRSAGAVRALGPLAALLLGLTGALALMCFIKAYGGAFSGPA
ncbi:MAG: proton-conducting transporter membrane subunit, partial [Chloroflexota bacterium]